MADELEKKIAALEKRRQELHEQIANSAAVLSAAEDKIKDLKARQQTRMRADIRLDTKIADQMLEDNNGVGTPTNGFPTTNNTTVSGSSVKTQPQPRPEQKGEPVQLITRELTDDDIRVDPNEKYH